MLHADMRVTEHNGKAAINMIRELPGTNSLIVRAKQGDMSFQSQVVYFSLIKGLVKTRLQYHFIFSSRCLCVTACKMPTCLLLTYINGWMIHFLMVRVTRMVQHDV